MLAAPKLGHHLRSALSRVHLHGPWYFFSKQLLKSYRSTTFQRCASTAVRASTKYTSTRHPEPAFFEYEYLEGVERLEKYKPGGYHPIRIGDVLEDRYEVVHKLGYGGYSTTWLCKDRHSGQNVALKVGTGYANPRESEILAFLGSSRSNATSLGGEGMIPPVRDQFILQGPNGIHACYTTVPAMCCLWGAKAASPYQLFPIETARAIIAQLILAVEYVHSRGVVHGDLHLSNMFLKLSPEFHKLSVQRLHEKYGTPFTRSVVRLDGKPLAPGVPSNAVQPVWLGEEPGVIAPSNAELLLKDFGEAYSPFAEVRDYSNTRLSVVPPEAHFEPELGLSFPSDIWSLGCAIWAIAGKDALFSDISSDPDDIIAEQIRLLGPLPKEWWKHWKTTRDGYQVSHDEAFRECQTWQEKYQNTIEGPRREAGIPGFSLMERMAFVDMVCSMVTFRPEQRVTASELVNSEWMTRWGLPEVRRLKLMER